ncbi:MAG: TonB family protein [Pyrinomonadaceae bacterium]
MKKQADVLLGPKDGTYTDSKCLKTHMNLQSLKYLLVLVVAGFAVYPCKAQVRTKEEQTKLLADVANDEKAVAACLKAAREEQIKKFGKPLPKISGHCWDGCPIKIVKPYYPEIARRLKIKGEVLVDTIVDEKGSVVFAKVAKGSRLLRKVALEAAYVSQHQPKVTCGNRPIKFRWTIRYYFQPNM